MNFKSLKLLTLLIFLVSASHVFAGTPPPALHVEGRYLKDNTGHIVNLHGFAQTYSPWFNEQNTKWNNYDVATCLSYNQAIIDKMLTAGWKVNFIRLHMDPYWSNTPGCTGRYEGEECFNETRFIKYLDEVFVPMAEYAISKGLYVVMRPPGVCPENIEIGGVYQQYLIKVWGIVSQHARLKNNPHIMFELANEPIKIKGTDGTYGSGNQGHFDNLKTYFQTIVNTIRANANNILWIPGLNYQALYAGYAANPIEGDNIGYAVHVYPGWFNSGQGYESFQRGWNEQVQPVADFAPIIVTEMDWAPEKYNKSWGKDVTGTAGGDGFGANFKKITDDCGNVSWLVFTSPDLLAQYGDANAPTDVKDFLTDPEACPKPVYQWFQDYAAAYNFEGASDNYLTMSELIAKRGENIQIVNGSSASLGIEAVFSDGHTENVSSLATITIDNTSVVKVIKGRIFPLKDGEASVNVSYTDKKGTTKQLTIKVTSTTFPLTAKLFNPDIWENGTFDESTHTLKTGQWGFGGWQYNGLDLSGYKYLVARLKGANTANVDFRVFDGSSYWGSPVSSSFGNKSEVVIPLKYAKKNDGSPLNPSHIYIVGFWSNGSNPFIIDTVFLSNSNEYDFPVVQVKDNTGIEITSITGFSYPENAGPSASKSFSVLGDMLKENLLIEASANFEISLSHNDGYATSLTLTPQSGVVATTQIFIRLKADLQKNTYSGSINVSSTEAPSKTLSLNGSVVQPVGIKNPAKDDLKIISTEYFTISGQKITSIENHQGILIEKRLMSDGSIITKKISKQ